MATQRLLYDILKDLSSKELKDFYFNVELKKGVPLLSQHHSKGTNAEEVVELMVEKYSEECVELTTNVLKKMKRTDLVQRLSDSSAGSKEKHSMQTEAKQWPSLIQRVETIKSDMKVLMDILSDLNEEEFEFFRNDLKQTRIDQSWWPLILIDTKKIFIADQQETVFLIMMTCGQHSVETTREILKKMKRTDLLQRLSDTSSRLKKKELDEQHSALIQKVATMAAVQQLMVETLHRLSERELHEFMKYLKQIVSRKNLRTISSMWRSRGDRAEIVDQMMRTYGQQSVELTREILEKMNRTDLTQMLSESSSALREKHSVDKHRPTRLEKAVKKNDELILLHTLKGLSLKELEKFRFLLRFTYFKKRLPQIYWIQTHPSYQLEKLVDLMVKNQQPVEVTKEVLMDMNRSDLVKRLSETSSGLKEKSPLDWLQTVETVTSVTELLLETLADLSEEELQTFMTNLEHTWGLEFISLIPWMKLEKIDRQKTVFEMIMSCSKHSVEITRETLKKMKRTDLVQRLSETSSTLKKKESEEQHSALIQKVATMAAVQQLLLETLNCLNKMELRKFKVLLNGIAPKKDLKIISSMWRSRGDRANIVDQMMRTYGQKSVELTREVLEKMNRTDLTQTLSESSSALREKHSVDKHQPTALEKAVKEDDELIIFQTLKGLSLKELEEFRFLLQFTYFQKSLPQIDWIRTHPSYQLGKLVDLMVKNQQPVEVTEEVLMDMNRSDLVERLSDTSSGLKEKSPLDWLQTVETVTSVTELLLETLADLSEEELQTFMTNLEHTWGLRFISFNPWMKLEKIDRQKTVFEMIMNCSKHSVEITRETLKKMKRTDLVQRLSETSPTLKKKESEEQHSALIQKVATMSAVQQLLLETLHSLNKMALSQFKEILIGIAPEKDHRTFSLFWEDVRAEIVNQMMRTYGQQSVELTREVLEKMKRTDLTETLSESSSALRVKHSVDKHQPTLLEKAVKKNVKQILSHTLKGLSLNELEKFRFLLRFTYFKKSLPQIDWIEIDPGHQLVDLMVKNQQPVEVTKEVLMDMNRSDLVERLSETSSGLKEEHQSKRTPKESSLTADHKQLLEILEKLSPGELEKFKHVLQYTKLRGFPKISGSSMETADKAETVRLMVENYGQQSVEVAKDVLERIKRMDLVEKLSESSSGCQGPSGSSAPEVCVRSTSDSSHWTKLEPGVNSSAVEKSPTYSLKCETGNYKCRVSGLRWICKEEVSFQYHFCSWGGHMERMESIRYMPAGPLMDIKVITGRLNEVYLPHWICTEDDTKISDKFAVLHIDDCGDDVEKVSEVTPSHVKLFEPVFSPRGVLIKLGLPVKISCCVLIYYKPNTPFLKLRVYLIPCDPALQQTVDKKELSKGFQTIEKPRPDKYLKMQKGFCLTADIKTAKICPQRITLRYDNQDPNFYEVFIEKPNRNFQLSLSYTSKKEVQSEQVWTCEIREEDRQNPAPEDKPSVDDQLSAQMQAVKIHTTDRERLLKTFKDLKQEEFKEFKWYLQDSGVLSGLPCISRSELENKDMLELVDLMLCTYRKQCMELTRKVLRAIYRNDLVETLADIS